MSLARRAPTERAAGRRGAPRSRAFLVLARFGARPPRTTPSHLRAAVLPHPRRRRARRARRARGDTLARGWRSRFWASSRSRALGLGRRPSSTAESLPRASPHETQRLRGSPRRPGQTTSCSATTRSSSRRGTRRRALAARRAARRRAPCAEDPRSGAEAPRPRRLGVRHERHGQRVRRTPIPLRRPQPREAFEVRVFGPFLVIRTVERTGGVRSYLGSPVGQAHRQGDSGSATPTRTSSPSSMRSGRLARQARDVRSSGLRLAIARRILERGQPYCQRALRRPAAAHGSKCRERAERPEHDRGGRAVGSCGSVGHASMSRLYECCVCTLGDLLLDVIVRLEQPFVPGDDTAAMTHVGAGRPGGECRGVGGCARRRRPRDRKRGNDAAGEPRPPGAGGSRRRARRAVAAGRGGVVVSVVGGGGERSMLTDRGSLPSFAQTRSTSAGSAAATCSTCRGTRSSRGRSPRRRASRWGARAQGARISVDLSSAAGITALRRRACAARGSTSSSPTCSSAATPSLPRSAAIRGGDVVVKHGPKGVTVVTEGTRGARARSRRRRRPDRRGRRARRRLPRRRHRARGSRPQRAASACWGRCREHASSSSSRGATRLSPRPRGRRARDDDRRARLPAGEGSPSGASASSGARRRRRAGDRRRPRRERARRADRRRAGARRRGGRRRAR